MSHTHAARAVHHRSPCPPERTVGRGECVFWSLAGVFFVALLWVGLVPKVRAAEPPNESAVIRFQVQGGWYPNEDKALESALEEAQDQLKAQLASLDPPVGRLPDVSYIRDKLVRKKYPPAKKWFEDPTNADYIMMTLDIEVLPEHLRTLRREERVASAAWLMGGTSLLVAVVSLFFRFEEWTKGYLTRWLVLGAVGAVALVAGLWWFVK